MPLPLFDSHAHLISDDWTKYPNSSLSAEQQTPSHADPPVTAESLIAAMDENGVTEACLVQRARVYGFDNSYIIDSARKYAGRLHPVVILDAQDPATPDLYRDMVKNDHVSGFRLQRAAPRALDTAWMSSPNAMDVWRTCAELGTPMTLILTQKQLSYLLPLIKIIALQLPDVPILIDHGGMPFGMTQEERRSAEAGGEKVVLPSAPDFGIDTTVAIFEDVPNVYFKITEINMECLEAENVRSAHLLRRMVDSFGPDRVMWGSDVGHSARWTYEEKVAMARAATDFLTEDEARKFLRDNAARVYGVSA